MIIRQNELLNVFPEDINNGIVEIPEGVKKISNYAFQNLINLEKVIIPDSVTEIGTYVFSSCKNLKSIRLPKDLKIIRFGTFSECENLTEISLPEKLEEIHEDAFYKTGLKEITLPDSVDFLGRNSFSDCKNLKAIKLSNKLNTLEANTFRFCNSLEKIEFPESMRYLNGSVFYKCENLTEVKLNNGLRHIGKNCFEKCKSLKEIQIPRTVETIFDNAFCDCISLKNVELEGNLKFLGPLAFYNCISLESINIPNEIDTLNDAVFSNCKNLKEISLPDGLKFISNHAFNGCENLETINLPSSLKSIGDFAFKKCSKLSNVTLPSNITTIGAGTFEKCVNLKNVVIPNKLKFIKSLAFSNCENLNNITLPKSVVYIGEYAFNNCHSLEKINIPELVTIIPNSCFCNCYELSNIVFDEPVFATRLETIGESAFQNCIKLNSIELPKSLNFIGRRAFFNSGLTSIVLPENINLEDGIFAKCENLKSVSLPTSLTQIPTEMFHSCCSLKSFVIPSNIKKIGHYAFASCRELENIIIPNSVEEIGEGAFYSNDSLKNITLPESISKIGNIAFEHCTNLSSINIPSSVKQLGRVGRVFYYFNKLDNGFSLSKDATENSIPLSEININLPILSNFWEYRNILFKEQKNKNISYFYNEFISGLPDKQIESFIKSHNFTFFKQLDIPDTPENKYTLFNALYNLGAVSSPIIINDKKIDYAQKVVGLLQEKISKTSLTINKFREIFTKMKEDGFKKEFTDFFLSEFDRLLVVNDEYENFIARCYNEFEKVQKTNTNNHGSQRQLKPTIEKFIDFFKENKFAGITDKENELIAETLSPYFSKQIDFDRAVKIFEEKNNNKTPDHILKEPLKEKDVFSTIDDYASEIKKLNISTLFDLTEIANNEFTFEWLSKNDPQNLILGKLCSCCAHIEGAGYGIMHASIVHPNVQNLVIRDKDGDIVAKSTLYINPTEGYGVFNNVEVGSQVRLSETNLVYQKFMLGVQKFAEKYNKLHPESPLKQINVGMGLNDLGFQIEHNNPVSKRLYKALNYDEYGVDDLDYNGDSGISQYVVWKNDENTPQIEK